MWVTLTATNVQNSLSPSENAAFTGSGSVAYLTDILTTITAYVRGKVQTWMPNQMVMGPVGTIPDETLGAAIILARFRLLTQLPGTQLITKQRESERDEAYTILQDVADGRTLVQGYPDGSGGTTAVGVPQRPATASPTAPGEPGDPYFPPYLDPYGRPVWGFGYW